MFGKGITNPGQAIAVVPDHVTYTRIVDPLQGKESGATDPGQEIVLIADPLQQIQAESLLCQSKGIERLGQEQNTDVERPGQVQNKVAETLGPDQVK